MNKPITEQQYLEAMEMLEFHERKVEQLKMFTKMFIRQWGFEYTQAKKKKVEAIDKYLKLKP